MDIMNYNSDIWKIEETCFDSRYLGKCEAIFAQGNGYLNVRNALEETYVGEKRNFFVTGTFNQIDENEVTELPNIPDITRISIWVNGHRFHLESGTIHSYKRTLDLKTGETIRTLEWSDSNGARLQFEFKRFVSLASEHVIAMSVSITAVNSDVELMMDSGIDAQVTNSGAQHFHEGARRIYDATYMELVSKTMQSEVLVAVHSANKFIGETKTAFPVMERRSLSNEYSFCLEKGTTVTMEKISTVHTSRDLIYDGKEITDIENTLKTDGMKAIREAYQKGYHALKAENDIAWEKYWKLSDIVIESESGYDQLGAHFALYHLNIMVKGDDNRVGIGAKGMTGEGYKGHSFWDTEMFILPYYTMTHPSTARALLEYRFKSLVGAREKAKENGYEGAMYPWESAWLDDGEVTPLWGAADIVTGERTKILTGLIEHHISADIAYAVWQYFTATGDSDYMNRYGYQIILETALFWSSRVEYNEAKNRYEINDVIGPDEYKEHVNNNVYTNYLAAYNMQLALDCMKTLQTENSNLYDSLNQVLDCETIKQKVERVLPKLYLPVANENGIIPQSDQYLGLKELDLSKYKADGAVLGIYRDYNPEQINEFMVSKQADTVMLLFVLDSLFDAETKRKNFLFYEKHTLHDSSLSKSTHCVLANDLDLNDMAYKLYQGAISIDLGGNMKSSNEGIHSASMGGIWQCAVMGFGGVRIRNKDLCIDPKLPKQWKRLAYRVVWQGSELQVTVTPNKVTIKNNSSQDISILYKGKSTLISANDLTELS